MDIDYLSHCEGKGKSITCDFLVKLKKKKATMGGVACARSGTEGKPMMRCLLID